MLMFKDNAQFYKPKVLSGLQQSSIYNRTMSHHQIAIVDKAEQETSQEDESQRLTSIKKEDEPDIQDYEIDHKTLPFIFRFNYSALQRLRLSNSPSVSKLTLDIFHYLKEKLVVRRYSEGAKFPNRMKYQEKVKFLIRAFDHRRNTSIPDPDRRKQKFNRQKQIDFFSRIDVRSHFLQQIDKALIRKRVENERRIKELQDCIEMAVSLSLTQPERAYRIFDQRIRRKQLPWTDNMFNDIEDFSKQIYYRFTQERPQQLNQELQHQFHEKKEENDALVKKDEEEDFQLNEQLLQKLQNQDLEALF